MTIIETIIEKIRTLFDNRNADDLEYNKKRKEIANEHYSGGELDTVGISLIDSKKEIIVERERADYNKFLSVYSDFDKLINIVSERLNNLESIDRTLNDDELETAVMNRRKKRELLDELKTEISKVYELVKNVPEYEGRFRFRTNNDFSYGEIPVVFGDTVYRSDVFYPLYSGKAFTNIERLLNECEITE